MQLPQEEPEPLSIPAPPSIPALLEPIAQVEPPITVAVTEGDAGSIDVSVRVLSPGEDATTTGQGVEPDVVSDSADADITGEPTSSPASNGGTSTSEPISSNVNVSVPVLSPGDDGSVEQTNGMDDGIDALANSEQLAATPAAGGAADQERSSEDASSAGEDAQDPVKSAEQYQESDSRYQSDRQSSNPAWEWTWYLTLDCEGNVASFSEETGAQSSLDWAWDWTWEWSCGAPPRPPPLEPAGAGTANEGSSSEHSAPEAAPTSTGRELEEDGAAGEPWLWSWTFTFCGETVSAALPISTQTELKWRWDWSWTWTCEALASEPAPSTIALPSPSVQVPEVSGGDAGEGASGLESGEAAPTPVGLDELQFPALVIPRLPFPDFLVVLPSELPHLAGTLGTASIAVAVELVVPRAPGFDVVAGQTAGDDDSTTISPPLVKSPLDAPGSLTGTSARSDAAPGRPSSAPMSRPDTRVHSTRPRHPGSVTPAKQRSASGPRPHAPQSPLSLPPLQAGISGPSGGFVPSGSVAATAALVAFLFLTAPGLGRRLRVARELRPRGTYGSSIDRPG